ncbi:TerD family protein [Streptomyces sp. NPDC059009]|uniref:TerD family protein n=1 Tax=Streptomyces sp. NPDC059009 TaxID=3346694 RepID=UPI0036BDC42F
MPVLMAKGQQIELTKDNGRPLGLMRMGIGWHTTPHHGLLGALGRRHRVHLGTFAVLYGRGRFIDVIFTENPASPDGSIEHTGRPLPRGIGAEGDKRAKGDRDDKEYVCVNLSRLPASADRIVFVVSSFSGQTFEQVGNAYCRLVDESSGREFARYTFTEAGPHTSLIMADVRRNGGGWGMSAIGRTAAGQTFPDLLRVIDDHA